MKDIRDAAMKEFKSMIVLGGNVPDVHAGRIYSVAHSFLKLALIAQKEIDKEELRKATAAAKVQHQPTPEDNEK